jgi:hypothetical protein
MTAGHVYRGTRSKSQLQIQVLGGSQKLDAGRRAARSRHSERLVTNALSINRSVDFLFLVLPGSFRLLGSVPSQL